MTFKPTGGFSLKLKQTLKVTDKLTLCPFYLLARK